jgi:hypothetical protein
MDHAMNVFFFLRFIFVLMYMLSFFVVGPPPGGIILNVINTHSLINYYRQFST